MNKWDIRFLELAQHVGSWSKDPSTQVGAVIVDDNNRVVSIGYNGFPRGVEDDSRLYDRAAKLAIVVHGEMNALVFAQRNLEGCTLYTSPFMPCTHCAGVVIQTGIVRVVTWQSDNPRWQEDFEITRRLFLETGILLEEAHKV